MNTEKNNINIVVDSYNSIENAMMQKLLSEGKTFPIEGMITSLQLIGDLQEELKNTYDVSINTFATSATNQLIIIEEANGLFTANIRNGIQQFMIADIYAKTVSDGKKLYDLFKKYQDSSYSTLNVKIVSFSLSMNGQLEKTTTTKKPDDFKMLSKNYYPFLDTDEMFKQYLISNDSLLLLAGESGTGKTKIIDMLLDFSIKNEDLFDMDEDDEEATIFVAYIKNPHILSTDVFWNHLQKDKYHFVVLDDMDHILIDRNMTTESSTDETRLRFISNFLSYTDGIFASDTKFVITTNQSVNNIDSAILRKGRCFDVLSFRPLTYEEGKKIWTEAEIPLDKFEEKFKADGHINAAELGANIEFEQNLLSRHTTIKASYILEEGISLYKTNLNKKISI